MIGRDPARPSEISSSDHLLKPAGGARCSGQRDRLGPARDDDDRRMGVGLVELLAGRSRVRGSQRLGLAPQRLADVFAEGGWSPTVAEGGFTHEYSAPSAGSPPWYVYEFVPEEAYAVAPRRPAAPPDGPSDYSGGANLPPTERARETTPDAGRRMLEIVKRYPLPDDLVGAAVATEKSPFDVPLEID